MLTHLLTLWLFTSIGIVIAMLLFADHSLASVSLMGTWLGLAVWLIRHWRHYQRYLDWLKQSSDPTQKIPSGPWHESMEKIHRIHRDHQRQVKEIDIKVQNFFEAIQVAPIGVIFLDDRARIEWCNLTAAEHLSIDPSRDHLQIITNLVRDPAFLDFFYAAHQGPAVIQARSASLQSRRRLSLQKYAYGEGRYLLLSTDVTQLELAETMRQQFVANVSHEIRTPLTVVLGLIETLKTFRLDDQDRTKYLHLLDEHAHRMLALVSDLLTLSRIEGMSPPTSRDCFELRSLIDEAVSVAQSLSATQVKNSAAHVIVLDWALPQNSTLFCGYRTEMLSAVSNLLNNAVRYAPAGTQIEVSVRLDFDDRFVIEVCDHGPGIPQEHIPRLSERFYRVDSSRSRETGGTGLGLAIVKHVAQRHDGNLQIKSEIGSGSCFALIFSSARLLDYAVEQYAK